MRAVVIGGTGHIGTYLIPRLVSEGFDVVCLSRRQRSPYQQSPAWKKVKQITIDRQKEDKQGTFGKKIAQLKGDIVIDLICFTLESAEQLVDALDGKVEHFLHCGTAWVNGYGYEVPMNEQQTRNPLEEYGIQKAAIEKYLITKMRTDGFPATILHPGHIVGPGWNPVNPAGNTNPNVFTKLALGEELALPNFGLEILHHVHADDVAQAFMKAIHNRNRAVGESFFIVSERAMTLRGFAEKTSAWFGKQPKLKFLPWEKWQKTVNAEDADSTYKHITHSTNCSIEKAKKLLGYQPRYTSFEAICEAVQWLIENNIVKTG